LVRGAGTIIVLVRQAPPFPSLNSPSHPFEVDPYSSPFLSLSYILSSPFPSEVGTSNPARRSGDPSGVWG